MTALEATLESDPALDESSAPSDQCPAPQDSERPLEGETVDADALTPIWFEGLSAADQHQVTIDEEVVTTTLNRSAASMMEAGAGLNRIKATLGHTRFVPWVKAKMTCCLRTAENYMKAAEVFEEHAELVCALGITNICNLAYAATSLQGRVLGQLASGYKFKSGEIARLIDAARPLDQEPSDASSGKKARPKAKPRSASSAIDQVIQNVEQAIGPIPDDRTQWLAEFLQDRLDDSREEFLALYDATYAAAALEQVAEAFRR